MQRHLLTALFTIVICTGFAFANGPGTGYDQLSLTGGQEVTNLIPGDGLPMLEIKAAGAAEGGGLKGFIATISQKGVKLILHYKNQQKEVGYLTAHVASGMLSFGFKGGNYALTDRKPTSNEEREQARVSLQRTIRKGNYAYQMYIGNKALEAGFVKQKIFSWGTGLLVYPADQFAKDEDEQRSIGYVDEKAAQTFKSLGAKRPYAFQKMSYRREEASKWTTWGKGYKVVEEKTDCFWFVDQDFANIGPAGVFMDNNKVPFLVVKGDWWMSEHIFDIVTTRAESEGAVGKTLRVLEGIADALDDNPNKVQKRDDSQDLVPNPTGYIGSFLTALIYFPEFREAAGIDIPVPNID